MVGIIDIATYVPRGTLRLSDIQETLAGGSFNGERSVMNFDEDSTTMAVEAIRTLPFEKVLQGRSLWFATTSPAYQFKSNSSAIHAACSLKAEVSTFDMGQSVRASFGALKAASQTSGIAVCADSWNGPPGSDEERIGGDGAGAVCFGTDNEAIAVVSSWKSHVIELLERWKLPNDLNVQSWDERFMSEALVPIIDEFTKVEIGRHQTIVAVSSPNSRVTSVVARDVGVNRVMPQVGHGYTGSSDLIFKLEDALKNSSSGDNIVLLLVSDGLEMVVLEVTDGIENWKHNQAHRKSKVPEKHFVRYADFLTWKGRLDRQGPRRPDPVVPAAPPSLRGSGWKFGLNAQKCIVCGTVHTPPERRCRGCGATDNFKTVNLSKEIGRVATFTVDRLAFSPAPPMILAVVDFANGARGSFEFTDVRSSEISIGMNVEMTFRLVNTVRGVRNYFWKVRPVVEQ